MRKEVLFAILAGGIFGLIIAFGIWRLNSSINDSKVAQTEGSPTPAPKEGLTIASPNELQVVTDSTLEVSGITQSGIKVVISGEDEDEIVTSDEKGEFKGEIELVPGKNEILVTSFYEDGERNGEQTIVIVYSSEFEKYSLVEDETEKNEDSTESSDVVREKVKDKLKEIQETGYSLIGTLTDISKGTFQMETPLGEIEQITIEDETDYVNTTSSKSKTIEFEDVAIGDYIIAMGFTNGDDILSAKRVLISTEPEKSTKNILSGKITSIDEKEVTLSLVGGNEQIISFGKSWKGPDLDELTEGELLIVVGTGEDEDFTARTIEQILAETSTPSPTASPEPEEKE